MSRPTVALTFDDGPSAWTPPLIQILANNAAYATFFVLGSEIVGREHVLQRLAAEGHEIGVHGWDHTPLDQLTEEAFSSQLTQTREAVTAAAGVVPHWWRPPWNRVEAYAAGIVYELGFSFCTATVDSRDVSRSEDAVVRTVLEKLEAGAIVGLHDGIAANGEQHVTHRMGTVRAVNEILGHCRSVTVSELLA